MKKFTAILLVVLIFFVTTVPLVSATESPEISSFSIGNQEFVYEHHGNVIVLTSYLDGIPMDRTIRTIGETTYTWENLQEPKSETILYDASNYYNELPATHAMLAGAGYTPATGRLGTVEYKASGSTSYVYRTLTFTSTLTASPEAAFSYTTEAGQAASVALTNLALAFGKAFPDTFVSKVFSLFVTIAQNKVKESAQFTFAGVGYVYNITARADDGRTSSHVGTTYYGKIFKNKTEIVGSTLYDDYYPEFLAQQNSSVARWFYIDFYDDTFVVNSFNAY